MSDIQRRRVRAWVGAKFSWAALQIDDLASFFKRSLEKPDHSWWSTQSVLEGVQEYRDSL